MAISYYPYQARYIGLSTDDKTSYNSQEGATIYYTDLKKTQINHGGVWTDYVEATQLVGSLPNQTLVEQKTQTDTVGGILTFSANISAIEIYNTDATNAGVFTVNGLTINVPATKVFNAVMGGTPSPTVTVAGSTTYIVSRYI